MSFGIGVGLGTMTMLEINMIILRIASVLVLAVLSAASLAVAAANAEPRAVLELFTSQGCSSCPPADKVIGEFSHDPSVIALSLPVDYWDYLGWKDTLALAGHTSRQRAYAKSRGDREVYTPQVVVNGMAHAPGGDKAAIEAAIQKTRQKAAPLSIPVKLSLAGETVTVTIAASKDEQGQADVWLCPVSKSVSVAIGRGENHGHTVAYSNVVRRWVKLGEWNGKSETFNVALKDVQTGDIDSVAVLVQNGGVSAPKIILGAAQAAVR